MVVLRAIFIAEAERSGRDPPQHDRDPTTRPADHPEQAADARVGR
jgi:hypothetical protein